MAKVGADEDTPITAGGIPGEFSFTFRVINVTIDSNGIGSGKSAYFRFYRDQNERDQLGPASTSDYDYRLEDGDQYAGFIQVLAAKPWITRVSVYADAGSTVAGIKTLGT